MTYDRDTVLKALIEYCERHVASARGWQDDRGYSCDELGCAICNGDTSEQTAEFILADYEAAPVYDEDGYHVSGGGALPIDLDDADEMADLLDPEND